MSDNNDKTAFNSTPSVFPVEIYRVNFFSPRDREDDLRGLYGNEYGDLFFSREGAQAETDRLNSLLAEDALKDLVRRQSENDLAFKKDMILFEAGVGGNSGKTPRVAQPRRSHAPYSVDTATLRA